MFCTNCGSQNHLAGDCNKPRRAVPLPPPAAPPIPALRKAAVPPPPLPEATGTMPHRLPGMPPVCAKTMLPHFATMKAASDYQSSNCPDTGSFPTPCPACAGFHLTRKPDKEVENVTGWRKPTKPFLCDATRRDMDRRIGELCVAEDQKLASSPPPPPDRHVKLPRAKKSQETSLFT